MPRSEDKRMTDHTLDHAPTIAAPVPLPLVVGCVVYALMLALGAELMRAPETYWHLRIGQWIIAHLTVPHGDMFSHTFLGQPWIAKEWLSQVLYAAAYAVGGWNGVVALACAATGAALALLARTLCERLDSVAVLVLVSAALVLAAPHLVARPQVLALPVMVAWVAGLIQANDRAQAPSLALLPLMTLWANLHGGFTLGLALIAPIGAEAVWNSAGPLRRSVGLAWLRFAALALLSACVTPYGAESILATYRIFSPGAALSAVGGWRAQDFSQLGPFELTLLAGMASAFHLGMRLPPMRIILLLGLAHMALSHVRNGELLGLIGPVLIATPLARQFATMPAAARLRPLDWRAMGLVAALFVVTLTVGKVRPVAPAPQISPAAAVDRLKEIEGPVFNGYDLGGYLIFAGVPTFIDGRTELYGEAFTMHYLRAVTLRDIGELLHLLERYKIAATLLTPHTPAVQFLDRSPDWERVYGDDTAVVHRRRTALPSASDLRGSLSGPQ